MLLLLNIRRLSFWCLNVSSPFQSLPGIGVMVLGPTRGAGQSEAKICRRTPMAVRFGGLNVSVILVIGLCDGLSVPMVLVFKYG